MPGRAPAICCTPTTRGTWTRRGLSPRRCGTWGGPLAPCPQSCEGDRGKCKRRGLSSQPTCDAASPRGGRTGRGATALGSPPTWCQTGAACAASRAPTRFSRSAAVPTVRTPQNGFGPSSPRAPPDAPSVRRVGFRTQRGGVEVLHYFPAHGREGEAAPLLRRNLLMLLGQVAILMASRTLTKNHPSGKAHGQAGTSWT